MKAKNQHLQPSIDHVHPETHATGSARCIPLILNICISMILLAFCCLACSKRYSNLPAYSSLPIYDAMNNSVGRFKTSYLADQMDSYFRGSIGGRIVVTTFVDINNLYGSSAFGRMVSEQLISELAMKGYHVVEMRQSEVMQIMMGQGEFGLSQEMRVLRKTQDIAGVIVGTYTVSPERVYINARMLNPSNSEVITAGSVEMPLTDEIERLLKTNISPPVMERIPVKGLVVQPTPRNTWQSFVQETDNKSPTLSELPKTDNYNLTEKGKQGS